MKKKTTSTIPQQKQLLLTQLPLIKERAQLPTEKRRQLLQALQLLREKNQQLRHQKLN